MKAHLSHMTTKCGRANRAALVAYGVASLVGMFMDNPSFLIGS